MTKSESRKRMFDEETSRNALGRCTENLASGNDRAVAVGVERGNVFSASTASFPVRNRVYTLPRDKNITRECVCPRLISKLKGNLP